MAKIAPPPFLLYLLLELSFHLLVLFQKQWGEYEHPWVRAVTCPSAVGSQHPNTSHDSVGTHIRQPSLLQKVLLKSSALWMVRHNRA